MNRTALSASLEDYLETIARITESGHPVRSKAIAAQLGIRTASVTGALHALREKGFIYYEPYGSITLTPKGTHAGAELLRTHEVLRDFLTSALEVGAEKADKVACAMEHAIPPEVMARFVLFFEAIRKCPLLAGAQTPDMQTPAPKLIACDCGLPPRQQSTGK